MEPEDFRHHAHMLVDWMADYMTRVEDMPVRAQVSPGEINETLRGEAPKTGEPFQQIMADFEQDILPGITHWQHPRFMAYFPANASPPSILAEMLTSTIGAQCMLWQTSPAATEMETRVLDWLRQMIGMPDGFTGVIQDSASSAILCAILTARERATGWRVNEDGLGADDRLAVYTSTETHSSTEKNVKIAGLGRQSLRKVPVDECYAMRVDELERLILEDKANGIVPACVVASIGATGVGAIDPLRAIGEICRRHGIFLHVDAAWAGSALVLEEHRWMIDGVELADSLVFNPHKWMMTNFDCSAHFVRDPEALVRTLSILPTYLQSRETGQVIDYRDWSVPLGRRFRALKLWFVLRSYGVEGIQAIIRRHIDLAEEMEGWFAADPNFELMAPRVLSLINFRYHPPGIDDAETLDRLNQTLIERINDDGRTYLTQNRVGGAFAIRVSIGQTSTERRHVEQVWSTIAEIAQGLEPDNSR
jgi:aromatic-L-amino-acid/L-tryptophan decarboxylase